MPAGSNINYTRAKHLSARIGRVLGFIPGTFDLSKSQKLCFKAGVPASNTANDEPNAKGDICLDTTNSRVYVCTAYSSSTSHTWVRIDG